MRKFQSMMFLCFATLVLSFSACKPQYPKCDNDDQCKDGEFCLNGQCQQCRDNKDCKTGEVCNEGRCDPDPNYCQKTDDCREGRVCKDNRCVPCKENSECPSGKCINGRCLAPGECGTDADCPENHECQNGICVAPPPPPSGDGLCKPTTVYFGYDEYVLTSSATESLKEAIKCIQSVSNKTLRIEGHCDPRGTDDYNLSLGDRRAQAVLRYLKRLGVSENNMRPVSKGKMEASGSDEDSWAKDRKVVFFWE